MHRGPGLLNNSQPEPPQAVQLHSLSGSITVRSGGLLCRWVRRSRLRESARIQWVRQARSVASLPSAVKRSGRLCSAAASRSPRARRQGTDPSCASRASAAAMTRRSSLDRGRVPLTASVDMTQMIVRRAGASCLRVGARRAPGPPPRLGLDLGRDRPNVDQHGRELPPPGVGTDRLVSSGRRCLWEAALRGRQQTSARPEPHYSRGSSCPGRRCRVRLCVWSLSSSPPVPADPPRAGALAVWGDGQGSDELDLVLPAGRERGAGGSGAAAAARVGPAGAAGTHRRRRQRVGGGLVGRGAGVGLVARGRLLPAASPHGYGAWRVGPLDAADLDWLRRIAAAMPPQGHAVPVDGRRPLRLRSPEGLVRERGTRSPTSWCGPPRRSTRPGAPLPRPSRSRSELSAGWRRPTGGWTPGRRCSSGSSCRPKRRRSRSPGWSRCAARPTPAWWWTPESCGAPRRRCWRGWASAPRPICCWPAGAALGHGRRWRRCCSAAPMQDRGQPRRGAGGRAAGDRCRGARRCRHRGPVAGRVARRRAGRACHRGDPDPAGARRPFGWRRCSASTGR